MARTGPQKESILQKKQVEHLNSLGICFVFRIKNAPTYDARLGIFRANNSLKGIPDIIGWHLADGKIICIETKLWDPKTKNVKRPSEEQKEFLQKAAKSSPYVGVAYSVEDAEAIVRANQETHPREIRTFHYMSNEEKKAHGYATREKRPKKPKANVPSCSWINWTDDTKR